MNTRVRGNRNTANFTGQTFALAGLRGTDRQQLVARIWSAGGIVVADVTESLNFLVVLQAGATPAEKTARRLIQQGAALRIVTPRQVVKLLMPTPEQVLAM